MSPVDAVGTQEVIKQRLKRSVTDVEVKDGAEVEVAATGWQWPPPAVLEEYMPILSILGVVLAMVVALPALYGTIVALAFMCGGPVFCANPLRPLLTLLFGAIIGPPALLLTLIAGIFGYDFNPIGFG